MKKYQGEKSALAPIGMKKHQGEIPASVLDSLKKNRREKSALAPDGMMKIQVKVDCGKTEIILKWRGGIHNRNS